MALTGTRVIIRRFHRFASPGEALKQKTVIVTGGCGFIGNNLVFKLLENEHCRVVNIDLLTYSAAPKTVDRLKAMNGHRLVHGSITDRGLVTAVIEDERPAAVLNLAAESHVDRSIDDPGPFVRSNMIGVYELLEACRAFWSRLDGTEREAFRFVQISTDEVFGSAGERPHREDDPQRPSSPYAASKAAGDNLVRAWGATYGLPSIIINATNTYGPYQFPEKLIPHMTLRALNGMPLPVYGDGRQRRDWLHVSDHVDGILAALENGRPGQSYNFAAGRDVENLEIIITLCHHLDRLAPRPDGQPHANAIEHVQDRPGHDQRYALDPTLASSEIDFQPKISLDEGLKNTLLWYLDNREWWEDLVDGNDSLNRIGLGGYPGDGLTLKEQDYA